MKMGKQMENYDRNEQMDNQTEVTIITFRPEAKNSFIIIMAEIKFVIVLNMNVCLHDIQFLGIENNQFNFTSVGDEKHHDLTLSP